MKIPYLICFMLISNAILYAQSDSITFKHSGFVDSYHALRSESPNDWMSSRTRLRSEISADKGNSSIFVSFNIAYNSILEDKTGLFLREAFFRHNTEKWDLKVGRQIITWGVADGIRITDLVSPMDYTEFLAQDYDDIRIPENGIRLKYLHPKFNLEGVFIPVAEFFQLPIDAENPWSVMSSVAMPYSLDMENKPEKKLSNSEYGGRLSFFLSGIDLSLSALHTWNKMPVINKSFSARGDSLYMQAHYERMNMLGADMSVPISKFVIRAEAAAYLGELQDLDMPSDLNATIRKNSWNGLFGLDFYPGNDWTVMVQYSHKYISDYDEVISAKKNTGLATFNISKKLFQTTLTLSSFMYYDVTNNGFYNRTSADYAITDQIHFSGGYDWFHGDKGSFAIYKNNSEYFVKFKYSF
ncbi:MAG: hypothetical protein JW842_08120 [Prolixibacteraceae bacterium]|nr:hypothetical protein [Prolixibacteraceae bacterium]